jgi:hypothetical protein
MRVPIVIALGVIGAVAAAIPVRADTHSCTTVDQSAKAYVSNGTSVSTEEKDKNCTFSVNGAKADGTRSKRWAESMNSFVGNVRSRADASLSIDMVFDLMISPFVSDDEEDWARSSFLNDIFSPNLDEINRCLGSFIDAIPEGLAFDNPFARLEPVTQDNLSCEPVYFGHEEHIDRWGTDVENSAGVSLRYRGDHANYSLFIPAALISNARSFDQFFF